MPAPSRPAWWMELPASLAATQLNAGADQVRDFAPGQGVSEQEALQKGMEVKAVEFVQQGAEVYRKA